MIDRHKYIETTSMAVSELESELELDTEDSVESGAVRVRVCDSPEFRCGEVNWG